MPFPPHQPERERICADWPAALRHVRSGKKRSNAVHALKYGGLPRIAAELATAIPRLELPAVGPVWLVPVPLGPKRLRQRGYNQSERLARALGRRWRRPVVDLRVRTRETETQTALTPAARLANVAGAFETRNAEVGTESSSAYRLPRSEFTLILVDDVFTTGATLAEAARALEQAAPAPSWRSRSGGHSFRTSPRGEQWQCA